MFHLRSNVIGVIASIGLVFPAAVQAEPVAQDIVNKASAAAYYQGRDGKAVVAMTITDAKGRERSREFTIIRTDVGDVDNGEQRFYVYFNRPADINRTAFMVWKHIGAADDRWLYLPALDLVKRIAASDERASFVGSHFFYEDVSGRGPSDDNHTLLEETDNYFVIESTPKTADSVEFVKYKNWIHKETYIPVKTEYYNEAGEVYRTYSADKVEVIEGYATVSQSRMQDHQVGGSTSMAYSAVEYDRDLPQDIFTERYLRNPPRKYLR